MSTSYGAMSSMEEPVVSGIGIDEHVSLLHETADQSAEATKAANVGSSGGGGSGGAVTSIFGIQMPASLSLAIGVLGFAIVSTIIIIATTTNIFQPSSITDDTIETTDDISSSSATYTLFRDGYDPIDYFTESPSSFLKYSILDGYVGVLEPSATMHLKLYGFEDESNYNYKFTLCLSSDAGEVSSCSHGSLLADGTKIGVNIKCTPQTDYRMTLKQYYQNGDLKNEFIGDVLCMYVRREIRSLTSTDLDATMDAMYVMWGTDEATGQAQYGTEYHPSSYFVEAHEFNSAQRDADHMHEGIGFLPQHIKLTNIFDASLRAIDPSICLPYWDYTIDRSESDSVFDSYIFQPNIFGTLKQPKDVYWGWTYKNDNIEDAYIQDGRWKKAKVDKNTKFSDLQNSFGTVRGTWTLNPSDYVSRFTTMTPMLPSCSSHYSLIDYDDYGQFFYEVNNSPHASTHGAVAATYGCDAMDEMQDGGYIKDNTAQLAICSQWGFVLKGLYRDNYISTMDGCTATSFDKDGIKCGFSCNPDLYDDMPSEIQSQFDSSWVPDSMGDDGWKAWREFICEGDGYLTFFGDHLDPSVSPSDPSFWVIHPTLERLLHAKHMTGSFDDEVWPSNAQEDYVCTISECYEEDYGDKDYYSECCYGHYEFDQLLDFVNGNKSAGYGPTNYEILKNTKPTSDGYAMPYIYDSFQWSHCDDYPINTLLETKFTLMQNKASNKKNKSATRKLSWITEIGRILNIA